MYESENIKRGRNALWPGSSPPNWKTTWRRSSASSGTAEVTEDGRTYPVRNEEVLKAMTADEMRLHLREAGFVEVDVAPGYHPVEVPPENAERLIFTALTSAGGK